MKKATLLALPLALCALVSTTMAQDGRGLAPVEKALEGWSAEETLDNIRNFSVSDLVVTTDRALWYHRYASQTNKTELLPNVWTGFSVS